MSFSDLFSAFRKALKLYLNLNLQTENSWFGNSLHFAPYKTGYSLLVLSIQSSVMSQISTGVRFEYDGCCGSGDAGLFIFYFNLV